MATCGVINQSPYRYTVSSEVTSEVFLNFDMQLEHEAKTHATDRVAPFLGEVTLSSQQVLVGDFDEIDVGHSMQLCALSRSRLNNPVLSEQVADGIASS